MKGMTPRLEMNQQSNLVMWCISLITILWSYVNKTHQHAFKGSLYVYALYPLYYTWTVHWIKGNKTIRFITVGLHHVTLHMSFKFCTNASLVGRQMISAHTQFQKWWEVMNGYSRQHQNYHESIIRITARWNRPTIRKSQYPFNISMWQ